MPRPEFFSKLTSLTKLVVYWHDGSQPGRFYSADRKPNWDKGFREPGMNRLERKYVLPNVGKFRTALIYENRPDGATLRKYDENGARVDPTESWWY